MDSAESEFIESLDFLSPPVKRIQSRQAFGRVYNTETHDVHLLRDFRSTFARKPVIKHTESVNNPSETSTSLVLEKTTEGQVLGQQYSLLSLSSSHEHEKDISALIRSEKKPSEKPLIQVTVIPKPDQVQAEKLLRRRRHIPKRVQSTSSNHENSLQTKNVYLIVAGRRREKIYEIKTTGSAKLSIDHDSYTKNEDVPITELTNFKHLIRSLNMDKKKKKDKKAPAATDFPEGQMQPSVAWKPIAKCNADCHCIHEPIEAPKQSRVRIFGQFGISEDDKYVLRYGATVDDKPVMSDVAQLTRDFSPIIGQTSYDTAEGQLPQPQDLPLQADYKKPPVTDVVSKESQGTQVDFNVQVSAAKGRNASFADKNVQCSCCATRSDHNTFTDCQNPMVIISVYPKSSPNDLIKSVYYPDVNARRPSPVGINNFSNHVLKTEKAPTKINTGRNYTSPRISRSPSPVQKVSRSKLNMTHEITKGKKNPDPVSEKRGPDRQKALRAIKEKIREKDKLKEDANVRKVPLKVNLTNAQVSNKNHQFTVASSGTQATTKKIKYNVVSSATQYVNDGESFTTSNATQYDENVDSRQGLAPMKHSNNKSTASKIYSLHNSAPVKHLRTRVPNAAQVPKIKQLYSNHATQAPLSPSVKMTCATQVSKIHPNIVAPRIVSKQDTFNAKTGFKAEKTPRSTSKTKAELGTNTDHARTKKAIVDTYTKKLTEQMYQNDWGPARYDNSKVTINIDGDREYYDVLFNHDNLSTDLTIRKTLKDMCSQKCGNEPPLECLLRRSGDKSPTRSPSMVLFNPSDDEFPLIEQPSRLTIRDSLEISHRREDRSSHNIKNTQTCLTAQFTENDARQTEFLAPIKHFTGDNCSLCDPIARDKQIRELLGVDKVKPSYSKTSQDRFCKNDVGMPYQCIYRQKCKESQVTEINYEFQKLCPCLNPVHSKCNATVHTQCRQANCQARLPKKKKKDQVKSEKEDPTQSAIYQQLILNRNVQVFLQVEQFSEQKPIVLSRQQYDKVKKTIQKTISMKKSNPDKRKSLTSKRESSEISIGEVRTKKATEGPQEKAEFPDLFEEKTKELVKKDNVRSIPAETTHKSVHEIAAQTDPIPCCRKSCNHLVKNERKSRKGIENIDIKGENSSCHTSSHKDVKSKKINKDKQEDTELHIIYKPRTNIDTDFKLGVGEERGDRTEQVRALLDCSRFRKCKNEVEREDAELKTYILYNAEKNKNYCKDTKETENLTFSKKTMSSVEIRYASVGFAKQLAYSSTDVAGGALSDTSLGHLNSFHTLFRGHRKCATPNLGTSAYSLYSEAEYNSENKCAQLGAQDLKPKKPFLRRLMSCLVMRSTRDSQLKLPAGPPAVLPSLNSSIDSYHISTSLAAMEVSSSIYDTSASFYSNHTILPVNSKMKRGFFSSVRGFLTNRKS